jgi:hypothetical protein
LFCGLLLWENHKHNVLFNEVGRAITQLFESQSEIAQMCLELSLVQMSCIGLLDEEQLKKIDEKYLEIKKTMNFNISQQSK